MHFSLENYQPQQQLTFKTLETVPQAYSLSKTIILSYLPSRNCHTSAFWGVSRHNHSNFGSHVFSHHPSGYSKPCHLLIVVTCQPVTPSISKYCLTFAKNKQTTIPAKINTENLRAAFSQVYLLSQAIPLSYLPSRNCQTNVFLKSLHIIPPILAAMISPTSIWL